MEGLGDILCPVWRATECNELERRCADRPLESFDEAAHTIERKRRGIEGRGLHLELLAAV